MKIVKRLILVFFILIVLIIGTAFALSSIYKDDLIAFLKEEINKNVNAKVDFGEVDLSLIRSFPNFNLQIHDYIVEGN